MPIDRLELPATRIPDFENRDSIDEKQLLVEGKQFLTQYNCIVNVNNLTFTLASKELNN